MPDNMDEHLAPFLGVPEGLDLERLRQELANTRQNLRHHLPVDYIAREERAGSYYDGHLKRVRESTTNLNVVIHNCQAQYGKATDIAVTAHRETVMTLGDGSTLTYNFDTVRGWEWKWRCAR